MTVFPYVNTRKRFEQFLRKIKDVRIPGKVDKKWLNTVGFDKSDDARFIGVLKFVNFLDESNAPTDAWKLFRGDLSRATMAKSIVESYSEIYAVYTNAHMCTDDELKSFFKNHSNAGNQVIQRIVSTFQVLCSFADSSRLQATETSDSQTIEEATDSSAAKEASVSNTTPESGDDTAKLTKVRTTFSRNLQLNVQIHISPEMSDDRIEMIFQHMRTYLIDTDGYDPQDS